MEKPITLEQANQLGQGERAKIEAEASAVFNGINELPQSTEVILTCDKVAEWLKDAKESNKSVAIGERVKYLEAKIENLVYSRSITYELLGYIGFLEVTMYVLIESLEPSHPVYIHLAKQVANVKRRYQLVIT